MPRRRSCDAGGMAPLLLFGTVAAAALVLIRAGNEGRFVYVLDDAYIHLAIARHLAEQGVWGVSLDGFASCSSSILWPLLLWGWMTFAGIGAAGPLMLNLIFAALLLLTFDRLLRPYYPRAFVRAGLTVFIALLLPLPWLIFTGMEHVFHTMIMLLLLERVARTPDDRSCGTALTAALAGGTTLIRYESLAAAVLAAVLLGRWRGPRAGAAVAAAALAGPAGFGVYAWHQGWPPLPSSVLLKGRLPDPSVPGQLVKYLHDTARELVLHPGLSALAVCAAAAAVLGWRHRDALKPPRALRFLTLAVIMAVVHFACGVIGQQYRYDGYYLAALLTGLAMTGAAAGHDVAARGRLWLELRKHRLERFAAAAVAVFGALAAIWLTGERGIRTTLIIPRASNNIYSQQYQMGRFVREYYNGRSVALNDIGAVCYLADIHLTDLWGLGSLDVARARLAERRGAQGRPAAVIRERPVDLAILYYEWFPDGLPSSWRMVDQWLIRDNVICGQDRVDFLIAKPEEARMLRHALAEFDRQLPRQVIRIGSMLSHRKAASRE